MSENPVQTPDAPAEAQTEGGGAIEVVGPRVVEVQDTAVNPQEIPRFTIHSNRTIERWFKGLVYADYGVGKTYLAGTSADIVQMQDVLVVGAEMGELTLHDPDHPAFGNIDIVHVTDYKTTSYIYDFLKAHCSGRDRAFRGEERAIVFLRQLQDKVLTDVPDPDRLRMYRTVIIDSLTEVENLCMLQLLNIEASAIEDDSAVETWDEYRKQRQMIHRLIRSYKNLPMNIWFTCPRNYRKVAQSTREKYCPMMTGKLSHEVQGFVDMVGHLVVDDPQEIPSKIPGELPDIFIPRRMFINPGPRHDAKSRFTTYKKPYFDNPTMPSIAEAVGLLDIWRNDPDLPQPENDNRRELESRRRKAG